MVDKFKLPIALSLVGVVLIIGGLFASSSGKPQSNDFPKESIVSGQKFISIDVSGAVNSPGVHQVEESGRIEDAINAAGGFSEKANTEYIDKQLNLAQKLTDGTKIYIPFEGETSAGTVMGVRSQASGTAINEKVNINTSTQAQLESLSGVGPVTASKIITGRPYASIEELLGKKIVGKAVYEKIKDFIVSY